MSKNQFTSEQLKDYFEEQSKDIVKYRKNHAYYWDSIRRYINYFLNDDLSILEIGCGHGELLGYVKGSRKVGIDFSTGMIDLARNAYPDLEFHVMDAEHIDLDEKFDVIILSNLVGYLHDIIKVFESMRKVCKPKTRIIITYYNKFWEPFISYAEWLRIKRKTPDQNWLSSIDLKNLLYLTGFETYKNNRSMILPYNIPLISVFLNRFLSRLPLINAFALNQYVFARPDPTQFYKREAESKYSVSVIIPARNESGNIEAIVERLPIFGKSQELIFIEGHSSDNTWEVIKALPEKFPDRNIVITQQDGKGKGDAVRKAFSMASNDVLMILDSDLSVPPEELPRFFHALSAGKGEFINGSRLVYPMEKNAMRFLNFLGNKFFSVIFSWLLEQPIKDTLCGTKVLFRNDYKKIEKNRQFFGEFDPFGDFDLIFGAYKLNLKIIDLPVRYRERTYGSTNISRFSHGFLLLRMVFYAARKIKFF